MPAETTRLRRGITGRDRWFLAVLAAVALVGTPSAFLLNSGRSDPATDTGCVSTIRAYTMGGATFRYCGADALVACRRYAPGDGGLAEQCERIGLTRRS